MMTDPADYAFNHWRRFESFEEHAERVEAAEATAQRYFAAATMRQLQTFNKTMDFVRSLRGPLWDRRHAAAQATWNETTAAARALFNITADEIMRDSEVSEQTNDAWDALIEQASQEPEPRPIPAALVTINPQPQAGL